MQFISSVIFLQSSSTVCRPISLFSLLSRRVNSPHLTSPKNRFSSLAPITKSRRSKFLNVIDRKASQKIKNDPAGIRKKLSRSEIKRLLSLARPERWKLAGGICLLFISSAVTMIVPLSLGKIIDIIYTTDPKKLRENLTKISMILLGIFILGGLCNGGRIYLMSVAGQNITKSLRKEVFTSVLRQEVAFFDKTNTGQLVNRLSDDANLVSQSLTTNVSDGLRSAITTAFGISYMFYVSPELTVVGLSLLPVVPVMAVIYGRFVKNMTKRLQDSLASATAVAEERISNIRTVKAFGNEKREVMLYDSKLNDALKVAYRNALARGAFFSLTGLSGNVIILTVLCYGGMLVSNNSMSIGSLTSFLLYAAYIGLSVGGLSSFYSELNVSLGASARLWEIIDRVPAIPLSEGMWPTRTPRGSIHFENVSFCYPSRRDIQVLRNLNLKIPEAAVTAIVGPSGSGKSTIAAILLRLYDPDEGKVLLDGVDTQELSPEWITKHVAFVAQEPVLFSGSIRENILYGAPYPERVSQEDLERATQEANCYDFIQKFPNGFETAVGEKGLLLSGGQKQRIALARALIKNPRILLLDEATSALDAESEHLVQEALERIMKARTVLVIAHRLSSIKNSDQIVVLERGQVMQKGTYQDLMSMEDGAFRKLIKHQAFGKLQHNSPTKQVERAPPKLRVR